MTLHLLDLLPVDDSYYLKKEVQELRKENQTLRSALQAKDDQIATMQSQLDMFYNMTPSEFKKFYKEKQKAKSTSYNEESNEAAPFSALTSENAIDLSSSNQSSTTEHMVSVAGMGYDGGTSSSLASSILVVGASLLICFLGVIAYRKHEKK